MQARMKNPAVVIPGAMTAIRALNEAIKQRGVPPRTLDLVHLRASQINGCSVCVGAAAKAREEGETGERLFTLVAWRGTPTSLSLSTRGEARTCQCDPLRSAVELSGDPPGAGLADQPVRHCTC